MTIKTTTTKKKEAKIFGHKQIYTTKKKSKWLVWQIRSEKFGSPGQEGKVTPQLKRKKTRREGKEGGREGRREDLSN